MELAGKVVVGTGGASGIGRALAQAVAANGAGAGVVAALDGAGAETVAAGLGGVGAGASVDVSDEEAVADLIKRTEEAHGPIDLFASNAGIGVGGGPEAPNAQWERIWHINV